MNPIKHLSRGFLFVVCTVITCSAAPEFSGVLTSGGKTYLGLREDSATRFAWCAVGESLGEFKVVSYDANTETAVLKRGTTVVELRLKSAAVELAPTVALVEQLARNGDQTLQNVLPELKTLETRRNETAEKLAASERRATTDESARERVSQIRRQLQIEDGNLTYYLQNLLNASRRAK